MYIGTAIFCTMNIYSEVNTNSEYIANTPVLDGV